MADLFGELASDSRRPTAPHRSPAEAGEVFVRAGHDGDLIYLNRVTRDHPELPAAVRIAKGRHHPRHFCAILTLVPHATLGHRAGTHRCGGRRLQPCEPSRRGRPCPGRGELIEHSPLGLNEPCGRLVRRGVVNTQTQSTWPRRVRAIIRPAGISAIWSPTTSSTIGSHAPRRRPGGYIASLTFVTTVLHVRYEVDDVVPMGTGGDRANRAWCQRGGAALHRSNLPAIRP